MIGRTVGWFFSHARDAIARVLLKLGVTPNMLTLAGGLLTLAAGVMLAVGVRSGWKGHFAIAGLLLYGCAACDMLDGAVARLGGKGSRFGAVLDSTVDRTSDFAIWAGLAVGFAWREPTNLTFLLLCLVALLNAQLISYVKARAENLIDDCSVGYWKRGERFAAVLIASFAFNPGALVLQQAISPAFTVWRRVRHTHRALNARPLVYDPRKSASRWAKLQPWMYPRMSLPYDVVTLANIALLIFFRFDPANRDYLGCWLAMA